ncbi:hypothetical protein AMTR_s00095p00155590 [Amborella trichopoda]|uniref:Peptidase A1 domain-containing protein n=1 Tax=Amborella trichopoda TaxID=13333 RepID=W1NR09_AMBTC|nr:hypothetical protein AMTR_s00095p00155590 [Amborella trichopoda]
MATLMALSLSVLLLCLPLCSFSRPLSHSSPSSSFKIALIHRDSPYSPMRDPRPRPLTSSGSLRNAPFLAFNTSNSPHWQILTVKIVLREPYWLIADTGSDLTWTQCLPCSNCFEQNVPIFNPKSSSTYLSLNCSSTLCQNLEDNLDCGGSSCHYDYQYGDGSATSASISVNPSFSLTTTPSSDPIKTSSRSTFSTDPGTGAKINGLGFRCVSSNTGRFGTDGEAGLVGLEGGPLSLTSQLGNSISNKFSHCLASRHDMNSTSVLYFGDNADFLGLNVSSTPIKNSEQFPTFYFLNLTDISVDKQRLGIPPGTFDLTETGDGGFIIDSGITLTLLPAVADKLLLDKFNDIVDFPSISNPPSPFEKCYKVPDSSKITGLPDITFHFSDNADWKTGPSNLFYPLHEDVICLVIVTTGDAGPFIFGNWQQQNMVEYDLGRTDCPLHLLSVASYRGHDLGFFAGPSWIICIHGQIVDLEKFIVGKSKMLDIMG